MQRWSLRWQSYTILNIYCFKYFSSDNFPFNRKILFYSHGGKLRKVDLKINEKKLKKRWTRNFEYIDKRSLFLPFFFSLSSNSIDVKLITALARRRVCHYLYSISWSNMKSIDRTVITTSENEFKRSLLQIKKKNEEIHTHAHKNIILLSNSLEHLEKKTKRFSLPPPTRISIISRSSLLDFFSFFPSSSWNITRGQFAQFQCDEYFILQNSFFFLQNVAGEKDATSIFPWDEEGRRDQLLLMIVLARACVCARNKWLASASRSRRRRVTPVCRYTRWADYVERRTGEMEEAAT